MKRLSVYSFSVLFVIVSSVTQIAGDQFQTGIIEEELPSEKESGSMSRDTGESSDEQSSTASPATLEMTPPDNPVSDFSEENSKPDKNALLQEGKSKKAVGAALLSVGAVFTGGALIYTGIFIADPQTFGILAGSTNDGFYRQDFYINPGLFALPIGAPCLATGIINLVRGKNMISEANDPDEESRRFLEMIPYLAYQPKTGAFRTGLVANF